MARHQPVYTAAAARSPSRGRQRHLFRGNGQGYPRSLCGDVQGLPTATDDPTAFRCRECLLVATTELTLALDALGLPELAVLLARRARDLSFETRDAQSA